MGAGIADIPGAPVDFRQQDSIGSGARGQADGRSHIGREWKQFQRFPLDLLSGIQIGLISATEAP
jgi:hypothetical protein